VCVCVWGGGGYVGEHYEGGERCPGLCRATADQEEGARVRSAVGVLAGAREPVVPVGPWAASHRALETH